MNWMWFPFLADIIPSIGSLFFWLGICILIVVCFCLWLFGVMEDELWPHWKHIFWCLPCFLLTAIIPSKDTIYKMAGFGAAQTVIQSKTADKAVQLANEYLDKQLRLIKDEKEQKK